MEFPLIRTEIHLKMMEYEAFIKLHIPSFLDEFQLLLFGHSGQIWEST